MSQAEAAAKAADIERAWGFRSAASLREEAAERLKDELLQEVRRQELEARGQMPEDGGDRPSRLCSRRFWYLLFGTLLALYLGGLLAWVCHDLAK